MIVHEQLTVCKKSLKIKILLLVLHGFYNSKLGINGNGKEYQLSLRGGRERERERETKRERESTVQTNAHYIHTSPSALKKTISMLNEFLFSFSPTLIQILKALGI